MALIKEKVLSDGNTGNYWRITNISLDVKNSVGAAEISLYKDKEARLEGKDTTGESISRQYRGEDNPLLIALADIDMTGVVTVADLMRKVLYENFTHPIETQGPFGASDNFLTDAISD